MTLRLARAAGALLGLCAVACASRAQAQIAAPEPRSVHRGPLPGGSPVARFAPGAGVVDPRSVWGGLTGEVVWSRAGEHDDTAQALLRLGAAAFRRHHYSSSGIGARWLSGTRNRFAVSGTAGIGSGYGPRRVFSAEAEGRAGVLRMEIRSTWMTDVPSSRDTLPVAFVGAPGGTVGRAGYTDAELFGDRRAGRLELQVAGGMRFGPDPAPAAYGSTRQWVNGAAAIRLPLPLALVVSGGWRPARPELAQLAGAFALVGVRLGIGGHSARTPEPLPTLHGESIGGHRFRLTLGAPGATSIAIKGDLTDWSPRTLLPAAGRFAVWETVLDVPPGIYHVNLSVDGGDWVVPPGLIHVADGFGGEAGLLVLQ